nr:MAG TPA: hypothetical protein [Caudoviricetes sp.]DAI20745.1 MAG TPA: hypothetical protein [Caudoviricetes sp.]
MGEQVTTGDAFEASPVCMPNISLQMLILW